MTEKELQLYLKAHYPQENEGCEWKEFKNLKNDFNGTPKTDVVSYVSALSNMEGGSLVIGVKDKTLEIVGTDVYKYDAQSAKLRMCEQCINLPSEGLMIEEFLTDDTNKTVWVVNVPKHALRLPVYAHGKAWQRIGDSLVELTESRRLSILEEVRLSHDWSAQEVVGATLADLDEEAVLISREGYKQRYPEYSKECGTWNDEVFLDKAGLTIDRKITRTTLLLVGKPESAWKIGHISQIVWKCFQDGETFGDIFTIPFMKSTSALLNRIRNYRFKIFPKNSLIPAEIWKYDTESILEALHNAIAHQDYEKNTRVIVTERKDSLTFENEGGFIEGSFIEYVTGERTPKKYRNPTLVKAMVNVKMIDTQGYGIHKLFQSQKNRFLPMPDYEKSNDNSVVLTIPGTVIDENYSLMLLQNPELSLSDALLLDYVQKGIPISARALADLRRRKLVEGKLPNIYISKNIARATDQRVEYSRHKGLDERKCVEMLLDALKDHGELSKTEILQLLWNLLSDQLDDRQKNTKIDNLLRKLRKMNLISNESQGRRSRWMLVK